MMMVAMITVFVIHTDKNLLAPLVMTSIIQVSFTVFFSQTTSTSMVPRNCSQPLSHPRVHHHRIASRPAHITSSSSTSCLLLSLFSIFMCHEILFQFIWQMRPLVARSPRQYGAVATAPWSSPRWIAHRAGPWVTFYCFTLVWSYAIFCRNVTRFVIREMSQLWNFCCVAVNDFSGQLIDVVGWHQGAVG